MGFRVAFWLADSFCLVLIFFWGGNVSEGAEQATSAGDEFEEGLGACLRSADFSVGALWGRVLLS
jgi:hypothetical protein